MQSSKLVWGIICIVIGISGFIISANYVLALEALCLGIGILLSGLANNNKDKSKKGKTLSAVGSVFYVLGVLLILYNIFFNTK